MTVEYTEDDHLWIEINVCGEIFQGKEEILSSGSDVFAANIQRHRSSYGFPPPRIDIYGHQPASFAPLLEYMEHGLFDTTLKKDLCRDPIIRLAKHLRMKKFLEFVNATRQYAHLTVLHPSVVWFDGPGRPRNSIAYGRQLVVQIVAAPEDPIYTTLVDGLNWLHRNRYTQY